MPLTPALPVDPVAVITPAFALLDLLAIAVFAASGALAAARKRLSIVTFVLFAVVTGTGGGTLRDLLIGAPVFWIRTPRAFEVCVVVALLVWFTPHRWWRPKAIDWFDAVGLAAYAVYGAAKALRFGVAPLPAMAMGVVTATAGGILRDVLAGEPSNLLSPEIYVSAAALAAMLFVGLTLLGAPFALAAAVGGGAGFALRAAAIARGVSLPHYRG